MMAKGQMRSNREAKKPKKTAGAEKTKGGTSAFAKPPGATAKSHKK
jgi:hypothetical protein